MKEWPRIKTRICGIKKKENKRIQTKEVLAWKDFARDLAEVDDQGEKEELLE